MKGNSVIIAVIVFFAVQTMQAQNSFEQYCYLGQNQASTWVPILHYQDSNNWYAEARYNYEELNTFSLYAGKVFSNKKKHAVSYSVTPLLGGVFGKFKGGSAGLNLTLEYGDFFFASQSQYTFSSIDKSTNFLFSWSELAYQPLRWIYFGLSAQHTYFSQTKKGCLEPGVVIGFEIGKWTFPLYGFSPASARNYFVVGVNLNVGVTSVKK